jgi:hypothetical protein
VSRPSRTPSWSEIEEFCRIDGWRLVRQTDHRFFQKVLATGEVLETHTSFASGKSMSQGRFSAIVRTQLKVTREQFWETLRSRRPAERPAPVEPAPPRHKLYMVRVLTRELGMSEDEVADLSVADAERLVHEHWSRPDRDQ